MNTILAVVLALVPSAHAAVFINETDNRNNSEVHLKQNSFGSGHGGSFFYPGSPGHAKWAHGRDEDKGSHLPHGHQHTVRPPHGGLDCDFCAPSTTPGPDMPPSCSDKRAASYCATVKDVLRSCAVPDYPELCAKTCGFCTEPAVSPSTSETATPSV